MSRRIILFVCFFFLLIGVSRLPYFNLILNTYVLGILMWIVLTLMWHVHAKIQFTLSLILILAAAVSLLLGKEDIAENIGPCIYILLWIGLLDMIKNEIR